MLIRLRLRNRFYLKGDERRTTDDGRMDEWTNGRTDEWTNGRTDEQTGMKDFVSLCLHAKLDCELPTANCELQTEI